MFRFADCRLDLDSRRLFRRSREVHLSPKAFALLTLLVENRQRALSKSELLDRVWPGVFVTDVSLSKVVTQIRSALGDDPREPRIVRTVHGYGYEFIAEALLDDTSADKGIGIGEATCWLVSRRLEFPLRDGRHVVGRDRGADIRLDSPKVSRRHAQIVVRGAQMTVEDLGSKNGTLVGGKRIEALTELSMDDQLTIGPFTLTVRIMSDGDTTQTEPWSARTRR